MAIPISPLIKNYLSSVWSNLLDSSDSSSVEKFSMDLRIADGPKEYYKH